MSFKARKTKKGIYLNRLWYSVRNVFYACGYGLPNCTCYAYGRFDELSGKAHLLPTGNAGDWWGRVDRTKLEVGYTPKLGAIICWQGSIRHRCGHVAVVEEILPNGDIITSNSGYKRGYRRPERDCPQYFWLERCYKKWGYLSGWEKKRGYKLQGFIYLPEEEPEKSKEMTVDKAKEIVKERTNLTENTLHFMWNYKFGDELYLKLAKAYKKTKGTDKDIAVATARHLLREKVGLGDKTLEFLEYYRWGDKLLIKLAKGVM